MAKSKELVEFITRKAKQLEFTPKTIELYVSWVSRLAEYYGVEKPEVLTFDQIKTYVDDVLTTRLGSLTNSIGGADWHFITMVADVAIPDRFTFHINDDGGHDFRFFWHPLAEDLTDEWHEVFHQPIQYLQAQLLTRRSTGRADARQLP